MAKAGNGRVLVAYLHPNKVSHSFSDSLMRMMAYDISGPGRIVATGGPVKFRVGSGGLVQARNQVAKHFLEDTDHEWLLMIDSDMGFPPDLADRLIASADRVDAKIMGALCFFPKEVQPDGLSGWQTRAVPTLYDYGELPDGRKAFQARRDYPIAQITRVAATGTACLLVGRQPLLEARNMLGDDLYFNRVTGETGLLSEDISFCALMSSLNWGIYVDTNVRTTHHKEVWLSEDQYWREFLAPPAVIPTAVIVPVMKRPHNAEPFMRSLRASTGLTDVYAVADVTDNETVVAWTGAGANLIATAGEGAGSFAEKVNIAASELQSKLLFITGDDVRFHPGWLDHAQHVMAVSGKAVIGTNDLGSSRVISGQHATHLLIRSDYVRERGASADGPGILAHEGYRHWYVDDEIVEVAKERDEWAFAMGSIVEHLHPLFGKGVDDEVYQLGQRHQRSDAQLFNDRRRRFVNA